MADSINNINNTTTLDAVAVKQAVDNILIVATDLSANLHGVGLDLFAVLFGIAVFWMAARGMFGNDDLSESIKDFISLIFLSSIIFFTLSNYSTVIIGSGDKQGIVTGFDELRAALSQTDEDTGVYSGYEQLVKAAYDFFWKIKPPPGLAAWKYPEWFFTNIAGIFFNLATVFVLFVAAFFYIVMFMAGKILVAVAVALGPAFIPWYLLEFTQFITMGWFRFLLSACLYQVVAMIMLKLTSGLLNSTVNQAQNAVAAGNGEISNHVSFSFASSLTIFLLALLITYMMKNIPAIANGLLSGSGGGFSMFKTPIPRRVGG